MRIGYHRPQPMAYFPDLSPYTYAGHKPDQRLLNVGWLDGEHEYPAGEIESELLDKLFNACLTRVRQMRGWHSCQLCKPPHLEHFKAEWKGRQIFLGSAEIRVRGRDGIEFASPNLIFHYVKDHRYLPPREFLDALRGRDPAEALEKVELSSQDARAWHRDRRSARNHLKKPRDKWR